MIALAESKGFRLVRIKGDHRQYRKDGVGIVTISGKLNADIPIGTEKQMLRQISKAGE